MSEHQRRQAAIICLLVGPAVVLLAFLVPGSETVRSLIGWFCGAGVFGWGLVELIEDTERPELRADRD